MFQSGYFLLHISSHHSNIAVLKWRLGAAFGFVLFLSSLTPSPPPIIQQINLPIHVSISPTVASGSFLKSLRKQARCENFDFGYVRECPCKSVCVREGEREKNRGAGEQASVICSPCVPRMCVCVCGRELVIQRGEHLDMFFLVSCGRCHCLPVCFSILLVHCVRPLYILALLCFVLFFFFLLLFPVLKHSL